MIYLTGRYDENCNLVLKPYPEEWRDIPGYEGLYVISNYGDIYSLPRYCNRSMKCHDGIVRSFTQSVGGKFIKQRLRPDGYLDTQLYKDSDRIQYLVHTLVALAFIGPRPIGMDVCHNDGSRTNNVAWNLRYGTRTENLTDMVLHGTKQHGETMKCAKHTNEQIRIVKQLLQIFRPYQVSELTGINVGVIQSVVRGIAWNHIEI